MSFAGSDFELYVDDDLENTYGMIKDYGVKDVSVTTEVNKALKETNSSLMNEMLSLKKKVEKSKYEISILEKNNQTKETTINELDEEIQSIEKERGELLRLVEILQRDVQLMFGDMIDEKNERRHKLSQSQNNDKLKMKYRPRRNDSEKTILMAEKTDPNAVQIVRKKSYLPNKVMAWKIDKIHNKRENRQPVMSEYFRAKENSYKMKLSFLPQGPNLAIRLLIYSGKYDDRLQWPFEEDVTIQIVNQSNPQAFKRLTKRCEIDKPETNMFQSSLAFKFSFAELFSEGLMDFDCFFIECSIDEQ